MKLDLKQHWQKEKLLALYHKYTRQFWLLLLLFILVFLSFHDAVLYTQPIGRITHTETAQKGTETNFNNENQNAAKEITYEQSLTVKILNGDFRGKKATIKNTYNYSTIDTEKYRWGDQVFLKISGSDHITSASITNVKRDSYVVLLIAALIYMVILIGGRRGILALLSLLFNIGIFVYGLTLYQRDMDLLMICNVLIVLFTVVTLLLVNGFNRRTFVSIAATLITISLVIGLYYVVLHYGEEIDYAALDYITGGQDLETIFVASISLAGLGAIMDVAVSVSAALNELVVKNPKIKLQDMIRSGRELGYDIMGTMINVLLFTYVCGLFPVMIIEMKNGLRLFTIVRLQIPFEICRFLLGGIGILLALPVSILLSALLLKFKIRRKTT